MTGAFLTAAHHTLLVLAYAAGVVAVLGPLALVADAAWYWWPRLARRLRPRARLRHRRRVRAIRRQYAKSGRTM